MIAWTIYDHPSDFPQCYVARKFRLDQGPDPVPTPGVIVAADIDQIRSMLAEQGLMCFPAAPGDDAVIVETWMGLPADERPPVRNALAITDTTASTSRTTGALTVAGGLRMSRSGGAE
jgi:hypothetical protein